MKKAIELIFGLACTLVLMISWAGCTILLAEQGREVMVLIWLFAGAIATGWAFSCMMKLNRFNISKRNPMKGLSGPTGCCGAPRGIKR